MALTLRTKPRKTSPLISDEKPIEMPGHETRPVKSIDPAVEEAVSKPKLVLSDPQTTSNAAIEQDTLELQDRSLPNDQNPYLKKERGNSRLKSIGLGAIKGAGDAANAALRSGARDPLAFVLGGAAGGGLGGGLRPGWDEELVNDRRKAELQQNIGFGLKQEETQADIGYKRARPQLELTRINSAQAIQNARERIQLLVEQNKMTKAEGERQIKELDRKSRESEGEKNRDNQVKVANIRAAASQKLPDSFYRSKDKARLKSQALSQVLSSGKYSENQIKQEVFDAIRAQGPDEEFPDETPADAIARKVLSGELKPADVFIDSRKGAEFQRELANTHSMLSQESEAFDRALDLTSKSATAPVTSYADFESTFDKYVQDLRAAKPADRQKIRRQFEQAIGGVRLTGKE